MQFSLSGVPEPSALSLIALGLGGLAMIRRRRSRA
ncbi:MAG: PEP-CTERM sorting domain-containing protein [Verrucomicrobia bacterium]|nr:PEP-CTERM sorting domain-containing protein [Verrucomicrobiota bacterium]